MAFDLDQKKKTGPKHKQYDLKQVCALRIAAKWSPSDIARIYKISKNTVAKLAKEMIDPADTSINQSNHNRHERAQNARKQ